MDGAGQMITTTPSSFYRRVVLLGFEKKDVGIPSHICIRTPATKQPYLLEQIFHTPQCRFWSHCGFVVMAEFSVHLFVWLLSSCVPSPTPALKTCRGEDNTCDIFSPCLPQLESFALHYEMYSVMIAWHNHRQDYITPILKMLEIIGSRCDATSNSRCSQDCVAHGEVPLVFLVFWRYYLGA